MKILNYLIVALTATILLSGCSITKFSASQRINAGRELLDLYEAHEKEIIGDAEYNQFKNQILRASDIEQHIERSNPNMVHVIAFIKVKPGKREELIKIFNENVPNVLAEDGCIQYTLTVDTDSGIDIQMKDDNIVTVIEKWESIEALHAHLAAPHMEQYRKDTEEMTEGVELKVLQDT